MLTINKITSNPVVDFAAEELKKYLRMMMPRGGEIKISYSPEAEDGFRLGVMSDFGLDTSEAKDVTLDDILHIDTDECGGIIAGSNPRSVLLAVYRYLTINGCRWLFPGIDGEFIPIKNIEPTKYHKMADCRYRGQCNEGAEAQHLMMEAIDFTPKIGMNIFMMEFDIPKAYYTFYYDHHGNPSREKETIDTDTVLQWKRQCEAELSKRGLQFHDMGHGWTVGAFDIDSTEGWFVLDDPDGAIPEKNRKFVAEINGKRQLFGGIPLNTNFCMSNPEARAMVADKIASYAEISTNVDYLHVWLADGHNNHCECRECKKKTPSDWYAMLMNDIDDRLTAKKLKTRIVFICYVDTTWAPVTETIKNPERFSLLVAAISRDYSRSVEKNLDTSKVELTEFKHNQNTLPKDVNEYIAHGKMWQDKCKVGAFVYEYHYWWPQHRDLGLFNNVKIVYNDVIGYKSNGLDGIVEDGSQRSFTPNGFSFYVYASTLFDTSSDFEEMKEDYFGHAYGDDYKKVIEIFEEIGKLADFNFLISRPEEQNVDIERVKADIAKLPDLIDKYMPFVKSHKAMKHRAQTLAYKLLAFYLDSCKKLVKPLTTYLNGNVEKSAVEFKELLTDIGRYEAEFESWFDQYNFYRSYKRLFLATDAFYHD